MEWNVYCQKDIWWNNFSVIHVKTVLHYLPKIVSFGLSSDVLHNYKVSQNAVEHFQRSCPNKKQDWQTDRWVKNIIHSTTHCMGIINREKEKTTKETNVLQLNTNYLVRNLGYSTCMEHLNDSIATRKIELSVRKWTNYIAHPNNF